MGRGPCSDVTDMLQGWRNRSEQPRRAPHHAVDTRHLHVVLVLQWRPRQAVSVPLRWCPPQAVSVPLRWCPPQAVSVPLRWCLQQAVSPTGSVPLRWCPRQAVSPNRQSVSLSGGVPNRQSVSLSGGIPDRWCPRQGVLQQERQPSQLLRATLRLAPGSQTPALPLQPTGYPLTFPCLSSHQAVLLLPPRSEMFTRQTQSPPASLGVPFPEGSRPDPGTVLPSCSCITWTLPCPSVPGPVPLTRGWLATRLPSSPPPHGIWGPASPLSF